MFPYTYREYYEMVQCYILSGECMSRARKLYKAESIPRLRKQGITNPSVPTPFTILSAKQRLLDHGQFVAPKHAQGRGNQRHFEVEEDNIFDRSPRKNIAKTCNNCRNRKKRESAEISLQQLEEKMDKQKQHRRINDESSSENNIIHVFCPKCNTKIPHTAEGIQQDQTRMLIAKVYHYFEQEYKELKTLYGNVDLSPLSKFRQRTTLATGVSDSMLQQILEEEKPREQDLTKRPQKRRMDEDSSSDESTPEDSDGDAEADNGEQEPEQPHPAIETLVVKIEQPEITIDEPEIFVPAPLKTEPIEYDANNEQFQKDPISLDIKTEPQDDEMEIAIQTIQPGTSKYKERKRTKKTQETSTQQRTQGQSSSATTSRNILMAALEQSSLLDETQLKTEEIDVHEEGFS